MSMWMILCCRCGGAAPAISSASSGSRSTISSAPTNHSERTQHPAQTAIEPAIVLRRAAQR